MKYKEEIIQIVDKLPEEVLGDLFQYLKKFQDEPEKIRLSLNLKMIMAEDKEVLIKLAK